MQDAIAERLEPGITPCIGRAPSGMIRPIDLDDEAVGGREDVDDVLAQHDLPSERDPELSPG
jgi:hypothetical protein